MQFHRSGAIALVFCTIGNFPITSQVLAEGSTTKEVKKDLSANDKIDFEIFGKGNFTNVTGQSRQPPNDCSGWGACSQICTTVEVKSHNRTVTSVNCSCYDGYYLAKDAFTCLIASDETLYLFYSTEHEIRFVDIQDLTQVSDLLDRQVVKTSGKVITFDVNVQRKIVYVLEKIGASNTTIVRYNVQLSRSAAQEVVDGKYFDQLTDDIGDIAIDWIGENIYWVSVNGLFAATSMGYYKRTLVKDTFAKDMSLVVDPASALLFWSEASNPGKIKRISMSGDGDIKELVNLDLGRARFAFYLTLDVKDKRLYFTCAVDNTLQTTTYAGNEHRVVRVLPERNLINRISTAVFTNYIYWPAGPEIRPRMVIRAAKWRGDNELRIEPVQGYATDIKLWHSYKQPLLEVNPCSEKKCDELCLLHMNHLASAPSAICKSSDPEVSLPPFTTPPPLLTPAAIGAISGTFILLITLLVGFLGYHQYSKRRTLKITKEKERKKEEIDRMFEEEYMKKGSALQQDLLFPFLNSETDEPPIAEGVTKPDTEIETVKDAGRQPKVSVSSKGKDLVKMTHSPSTKSVTSPKSHKAPCNASKPSLVDSSSSRSHASNDAAGRTISQAQEEM